MRAKSRPDWLFTASDLANGTREIGSNAVWSLSSAKIGHGIENLRDDSVETFWQSDAQQPHVINVQFHNKVAVSSVALYCSITADESYTPNKIAIRAGSTFHDVIQIRQEDLPAPEGWIRIPLTEPNSNAPLKTNLLQIVILSNHQNGKDSHLRQIKIYGPQQSATSIMKIPPFESVNFTQHSIIK